MTAYNDKMMYLCKLLVIKMKYAIIAAGEGSRLLQEGVGVPKPLVEVCGERLIDRLIRIFVAEGADEVCVICNDLSQHVSNHLSALQRDGFQGMPIPLRFCVKTTSSSMHSFYELSDWLEGTEPFVLTTIDTIFREEEFHHYVAAFKESVTMGYDGMMGVTDFVDDEKPLYVGVDADEQLINGFYDEVNGTAPLFVSGGIYGLTPQVLLTLKRCIERGESRMRNFQRALVADGLKLQTYRFSKVLDIDHKSDIRKATAFLQNEEEV